MIKYRIILHLHCCSVRLADSIGRRKAYIYTYMNGSAFTIAVLRIYLFLCNDQYTGALIIFQFTHMRYEILEYVLAVSKLGFEFGY